MSTSDGIPAIGAIFIALALAFLEWLAWKPWALVLVFASLIGLFGWLLYLNLATARNAKRIADAIEREEKRKRKPR